MALYDKIRVTYDSTRQADPFIAARIVHHLGPRRDALYLDIGCGTANYTRRVAEAGFRILGVDPSVTMLGQAASKDVMLCRASAEKLPLRTTAHGGAISINAHHHFTDADAAFLEIFRVLAPSSRLVMFHSTADQMRGYWLNEYFPRTMEKSAEMYFPIEPPVLLERAGLRLVCQEPYEVREDLKDLFLYCGKHRPELYLDDGVRAGISTFSAVADRPEIALGCEKLRRDIASGRIHDIIASYRHDRGDYMFTVAEK